MAKNHVWGVWTLVVTATLLLSACRDTSQPVAPQGTFSPRVRASLGGHATTFLAYLNDVPGFGGAYYDGNEDLVVFLKDSTQQSVAVRVFARFVGQSYRPKFLPALQHAPTIRFASARYDYAELLTLKDRVVSALAPAQILTGIGIDDARNGIEVNVQGSSMAEAEQRLAAAGIPSTAVFVSVREAPHTLSGDTVHVNSVRTPLIGGWQV